MLLLISTFTNFLTEIFDDNKILDVDNKLIFISMFAVDIIISPFDIFLSFNHQNFG